MSNYVEEKEAARFVDDDEEEQYGQQDDPEAECESSPALTTKPEPSYTKANDLEFYKVCVRMEWLWRLKAEKNSKAVTNEKKLQVLLPPQLLRHLKEPATPGGRPESIFPLYRLFLPDKDGSRRLAMKEKTIAGAYAAAFALTKNQIDYQKLFNFSDPAIVGTKGVGDFSLVLQQVTQKRLQHFDGKTGSDFTVGHINALLDDLSRLPQKAQVAKSQHDWRSKSGKKRKTLKDLRAEWVKRLNPEMYVASTKRRGLSPLEHKWLVRILLERPQFGLGWKILLGWYDPMAPALWSAHNSLKGCCTKLCDPGVTNMIGVVDQVEGDGNREIGPSLYLPKTTVPLQFGNTFSPMLSERTGFRRILTDLSTRHREFSGSELCKNLPAAHSLALKHPAFSVETKLDGERLLVHFSRDGVVKMHTRRGNWYSELYSPVLGPPMRKALEKHKMDIILDGEVLAWDSGRQETVPFGNNRTIAKLRRRFMHKKNMLDKRDEGLHKDDKDNKSMNASNSWNDKNYQPYELAGEQCWLQFVAFDVVYVDGPGAAEFLSQTVSEYISPRPSPGSIIGLDGMERKRILYKLISVQEHEVEIVDTVVVRPNGRTADGKTYFSAENPTEECGYPAYLLDSIGATLSNVIPDLTSIDMKRRKERSDEEISLTRALTLDHVYREIVESRRLEGLLFKDLSTPYFLGETSRSLAYWHKFKPDYFNGSVASDLDLVIIGGYFATGLRFSGKPSAFLCACLDSEDGESFFPLCRVNGGSVDTVTFNNLLNRTGFRTSSELNNGSVDYGRWFREEDHGKSTPDFVSLRSPQNDDEEGEFRLAKKEYPDLWIDPKDSAVITLNAGEITHSDAFPVRLTLRFPRITKVREDKQSTEIESDRSLWRIYQDVIADKSQVDTGTAFKTGSPVKSIEHRSCRFLTEDQFLEAKKREKKRSTTSKRILSVATVPEPSVVKSQALDGVSFTVLDGNYWLEEGSIDADEGKEQGWIDKARLVETKQSVEAFIKSHGGVVKIAPDKNTLVLGGCPEDARVVAHIKAIENARDYINKEDTKSRTQKAQNYEEMAKNPGVLRWTYVYSMLNEWLSNNDTANLSIKKTNPDILRPSVLNYLSRPEGSRQGKHFGFEEIETVSSMRRALDIVDQRKRSLETKVHSSKRAYYDRVPWQCEALDHLKAQERWIVSPQRQELWHYTTSSTEDTPSVVIYPDMFGSDFGLCEETAVINERRSGDEKDRWTHASVSFDAIASVLPLARAMGAIVTPHLHNGVTHILCDLQEGFDQVDNIDQITKYSFLNENRGNDLIKRVNSINTKCIFIGPDWIRNTWGKPKSKEC